MCPLDDHLLDCFAEDRDFPISPVLDCLPVLGSHTPPKRLSSNRVLELFAPSGLGA